MARINTLVGKNGATTPLSHPLYIVTPKREKNSLYDEVLTEKEVPDWLN